MLGLAGKDSTREEFFWLRVPGELAQVNHGQRTVDAKENDEEDERKGQSLLAEMAKAKMDTTTRTRWSSGWKRGVMEEKELW